VVTQDQFEEFDEKAIETVDEAVKFADQSPFPDLDSLYDDVYVFTGDAPGWWTVDERSPEVHRGEHEREAGELPHQLAEAGAAYANVGDKEARNRRQSKDEDDEEESSEDEDADQDDGDEVDEPGEGEGGGDDAGEGEVSGDEPEAEGGAD
jgi:hypothetical protein